MFNIGITTQLMSLQSVGLGEVLVAFGASIGFAVHFLVGDK